MIVDTVSNLEWYHFVPSVREAFSWIDAARLSFDPPCRLEIGTEGIYALPQAYAPKPQAERTIEAHRSYIDVHVMVEGVEFLGVANTINLASRGYDKQHDTETLTGDVELFALREGEFAVLFPQDAHLPGVKARGSTRLVKKVVLKVPVTLWDRRR